MNTKARATGPQLCCVSLPVFVFSSFPHCYSQVPTPIPRTMLNAAHNNSPVLTTNRLTLNADISAEYATLTYGSLNNNRNHKQQLKVLNYRPLIRGSPSLKGLQKSPWFKAQSPSKSNTHEIHKVWREVTLALGDSRTNPLCEPQVFRQYLFPSKHLIVSYWYWQIIVT